MLHFPALASYVLLLLLLTALPQLSDAQSDEQPLEFQSVGDGYCMDCSGAGGGSALDYDSVGFKHGTNSATITSVDDCKRLCTACSVEVSSVNLNRVLRGFEYEGDYCYCLFEDDTVDITVNECKNIGTAGESRVSYYSGGGGTGEMCTPDGCPGVECFKLIQSPSSPTKASKSPKASKVPKATRVQAQKMKSNGSVTASISLLMLVVTFVTGMMIS